jgi:uncharacterized phage protein gp47/JayE
MTEIADFSEYVDLTVYDKNVQSLLTDALTNMQVDFPEWVPRVGSAEVVLLETFALLVNDAIFAANRVPDGIVQAMLKFYGVERSPGVKPSTTLKFSAANANGLTVPADSAVGVDPGNGLDPVVFRTDVELVIPAGNDYGIVSATGTEYTSRANTVPAGTYLELLEASLWIDTVQINTAISGGADPETDAEFIQRGVNRFGRMSDTLVTANDFFLFVSESPYVTKVTVVDNMDPATWPVEEPGHITIVMWGIGTTLTSPQKTSISEAIDLLKQLNLVVHLEDSLIETVDVQAEITYKPGYSQAGVVDAVDDALRAYLTPETWDGGDTVRRNELITLISNIDGVDYVTDLVEPAADISLNNPGDLPQAGVVHIIASLP